METGRKDYREFLGKTPIALFPEDFMPERHNERYMLLDVPIIGGA